MYCFFIIFVVFIFIIFVVVVNFKLYENGCFGYVIDLLMDFKKVFIFENGDGVGFESVDGLVKLLVWGGYLLEGGFR